jgi:hypothetical protein
MSATLPGPGIDVEICLGVGQAMEAGVWDSGRWDVEKWGQSDTSLGDWVDVTCDVADGVAMTAGASNVDGVVTRWEAATLAFTLRGTQYDPRSGPWAGTLGPSIQVRFRWRVVGAADWTTGFLGFVDDDGFKYDPKAKRAVVACTDGTRVFQAFDGVEQSPIGQGETAAQRVTRILDMVAWPMDRRDVTAGGVTVKATTLADVAWTMLLAVADTDLALLWLNRAGALSFRPEGKTMPSRVVSAVIGCEGVDVPPGATRITPLTIQGQQSVNLRNIVSVSRQAANDADTAQTVTVRDETSIARYFPKSYERTDLIHTDDAWSQRVADSVLQSAAWPSSAPDSVDLDSRADHAATALLLGLEPSLSVVVDDGNGGRWTCEPAGWTVEVARSHVSGTISLLDVSLWLGSEWDTAVWDDGSSRWGF